MPILSRIVIVSRETKLSKLFFYILLLFLPFGTKEIFFSPSSFIGQYHIFYNSYFLYLTDFLIFSIILAWLWEKRKDIQSFHKLFTVISQDKIYRLSLAFLLVSILSVLIVSRETGLGLYGFLKLCEVFFLFSYIRENIHISREMLKIGLLLVVPASLEAILGLGQYFTQASFGLKILGEEYLRAGLRGVAEFYTHGLANPLIYKVFPYFAPISRETINIRAYGTLPHPNVLSGILFFGAMVNLLLIYSTNFYTKKGPKTSVSRETLVFPIVSFVLITLGLTVSFSRTSWLISAMTISLWFLSFIPIRARQIQNMNSIITRHPKEYYQPSRLAAVLVVVLVSGVFSLFLFSTQIRDRLFFKNPRQTQALDESFADRERFGEISLAMIKRHPWLGVGQRNFVVAMDEFDSGQLKVHQHQPVHNIYLLIAAEIGIIGLLIFLWFIMYIVRHGFRNIEDPLVRRTLLLVLGSLMAIGLFDHYLLTLHHGMLIFWTVLGFLATKQEDKQ